MIQWYTMVILYPHTANIICEAAGHHLTDFYYRERTCVYKRMGVGGGAVFGCSLSRSEKASSNWLLTQGAHMCVQGRGGGQYLTAVFLGAKEHHLTGF